MKTNLLTLVITLTLGVILAGSLLMPVIEDTKTTIGPEITLDNNASNSLRTAVEGDVLQVYSSWDTSTSSKVDVWTLNGTTIDIIQNVALVSDGLYIQSILTGPAPVAYVDMVSGTSIGYINGATSTSGPVTISATFGSDSITFKVDRNGTATQSTHNYTWGLVLCNDEEGEYYAAVPDGVGYITDTKEVILGGLYSTGDLDTPYYYYDGVAHVSVSAYTIDVALTTSVASGTTDIYNVTSSVTITDGDDSETFTPYWIMLPHTVTGHASSGAAYNLLGVIPIIVITGILLAGVGAIFVRNRD